LQRNDNFRSFQICDISGRIIIETTLTNHQIDVSTLKSGVYHLIVMDNNNTMYQAKFVKK